MERSDERLAPVFYLPGAEPPSDRHPARRAAAAAESRAAVEAASLAILGRDEPDPAPAVPAVPVAAHDVDDLDESPPDREAELRRAENVSMHALTRRGVSRRELERTLRSRDLSDDVIAHEVERLERVGLLDDIALAQNLVGILQERKGLGRTGIAAELTRRLLAPAAIEYALELVDTSDELSRARELAERRAAQLTSYDRATAERRLSGYLARRGYSGSTVRAAVDHALSSLHVASGVRFR